jgi:hypothetical protein
MYLLEANSRSAGQENPWFTAVFLRVHGGPYPDSDKSNPHPHTLTHSHTQTLTPSHPYTLTPSHTHTLTTSHPHTITSLHPIPLTSTLILFSHLGKWHSWGRSKMRTQYKLPKMKEEELGRPKFKWCSNTKTYLK